MCVEQNFNLSLFAQPTMRRIRWRCHQLSSLGVYLFFLYTLLYFLNCLKWAYFTFTIREKNIVRNKCVPCSTYKKWWYYGKEAHATLYAQLLLWNRKTSCTSSPEKTEPLTPIPRQKSWKVSFKTRNHWLKAQESLKYPDWELSNNRKEKSLQN